MYITGLVRDERGQKMSKSKGNVVDPLEVMDEIGADALRFTLTAMAAPGMDIPLSEGRMTGYRQFINKIWNALAVRPDERRRRGASGRRCRRSTGSALDPSLDPAPAQRRDAAR